MKAGKSTWKRSKRMLPEKLLGNSIQLCGDLPKILIQIQCACTDQVATQVEQTIRGDSFLRFGVDQQPRNISGMGNILIFDVGIDGRGWQNAGSLY